MVVKPMGRDTCGRLRFESSVISYGCQTRLVCFHNRSKFESSVISYGCQTAAQQAF